MQITEGEKGDVIAEVKRVDGSNKPLYLPAAERTHQHVNVGTLCQDLHACFHTQAKPGHRTGRTFKCKNPTSHRAQTATKWLQKLCFMLFFNPSIYLVLYYCHLLPIFW